MYRSTLLVAAGFCTLLLASVGCSGSRSALPPEAEDPSVVAVIGPEVVTLDEFERRYTRSSTNAESAAQDSVGAYLDFLDRYVEFRLKVLAAQEEGYAQDADIQQEINTYRSQLARPYLLEREVVEPIIRDLYAKSQEMVDASHLLIRVDQTARPADTLAAYERIASLRDSVMMGQDFNALAASFSEDPSAQRPSGPGSQGRLGYFSSGQMVGPFEDQAYATPVGEVSPIFRTRYGYHILFVHDRRAAMPNIEVAHIMVRVTGPSPADSAQALARMDTVLTELASGSAFADLAATYSDDRNSALQGGSIGTIQFGNQQIPASFREAAFALEAPGDISPPVETPFGFHVIELRSRATPPAYEDQVEELKQRAARLPRTQAAQDAFAREVREQAGFRFDSLAVRDLAALLPPDSAFAWVRTATLPDSVANGTVASIGDSTYTFAELAAFAQQQRLVPNGPPLDIQLTQYTEAFMNEKAIDFEAAALEQRNDEFGLLMDEFRSGLLLFNYMEDRVWNAAAEDTTGLMAYHAERADQYTYPERKRIMAVYSASDSLLNVLRAENLAGPALVDRVQGLQADTSSLAPTIRMDTTRVASSTSSIFDQAMDLDVGSYTAVLPYRNGHALLRVDGIEAPRLKTFEEARTELLGEYQDLLEDQLIEQLNDRFSVFTFPERLESAFGDTQPPDEPAADTPSDDGDDG
ncbi:MAG: peptidylprolyl isomerase [Bacteroidota bacterium]